MDTTCSCSYRVFKNGMRVLLQCTNCIRKMRESIKPLTDLVNNRRFANDMPAVSPYTPTKNPNSEQEIYYA